MNVDRKTLLYIGGGALALYFLPTIAEGISDDITQAVRGKLRGMLPLADFDNDAVPLNLPDDFDAQQTLLQIIDHPQNFDPAIVRAAKAALEAAGIYEG